MEDDDLEFMDEASRAFIQEPMKVSSYMLWAILAFFSLMFIWAFFGKLDERTSAEGTVMPSSMVQTIQNLEGGIVLEINVEEGSAVEEGEVLLKIDPSPLMAAYEENLVKYNALLAKYSRLQAEDQDLEAINFPESLHEKYPAFVESEVNLFRSNRENHNAAIERLQEKFDNVKEQYDLSKPMAEEGIISKIELLKIEKDMDEAENSIAVQRKEYKSKINEKITEVKSEMDALKESVKGTKERIDRTVIKAPMKGIVKKLDFHTVGGVIKPAEEILEIVPVEQKLLVEAKVEPAKIGFIHPGQEADVKVTAYDSSVYGSLTGKVTYVSADTVVEEDESGRNLSYFKVRVETEKNHLDYNGDKLPIIPGMEVNVSILTGDKTILEYILKPIIKTKQNALTEK